MMAEQEMSWEEKLAEARKRDEEQAAKAKEEAEARQSGLPHLVNLNEDPMLDRKVLYEIKQDEELTCGRRKKGSAHKLQLGGTGVSDNHVKWVIEEDGSVRLVPLDEKALPQIKVNGKTVESMEGVIMKPNDRICIGPAAIFLFKNRDKEDGSEKPDTADNPITYDDAAEEVYAEENAAQKEAQDAYKAQQEEEHKKAMAEMEAKLEEERNKADAER